MKRLSLFLLTAIALGQSSGLDSKDWELIRSEPNKFGGTQDFVLIPEAKQRDRDYYLSIADAVCGTRTSCMVNFWTDRDHIPKFNAEGWIPVQDLAVMTASYERSPNYQESHLRLACWLYPNRKIGEAAKCSYLPGAPRPPE